MTTATAPSSTSEAIKGDNKQSMISLSPEQRFRKTAAQVAGMLLREWVGEERAAEAVGRISTAIAASAASARDPADFYACTPQSIANCVAIAALTGLMPGVGSTALAYVYPQAPRKDEQPQLQYTLSHRGQNALARRCGQTMIALPIGYSDKIHVTEDGEVKVDERDIDNPPMTFEEVRGVMILVKDLSTGHVITRGLVPKKLMEQRRAMSRSWNNARAKPYSTWTVWPVEMCLKTGMHYAIARGWCVIDDTSAARALSADQDADLAVHVLPIDESTRIEDQPTNPKQTTSERMASGLQPAASATTPVSPPGKKDDLPPEGSTQWWLGRTSECKDKDALMRLHENWELVRSDKSKDDQEAVEAAFVTRFTSFPTQ